MNHGFVSRFTGPIRGGGTVAALTIWAVRTKTFSEIAATRLTQAVTLVDAGLFPRTTRGRCDYCDVLYACGVTAWARARKREHEALAPTVAASLSASARGRRAASAVTV